MPGCARERCRTWRRALRSKWTPTRSRIPKPFSALPTGIYEAQAVLDVNHNYNYKERGPDDWVSPVVMLAGWKPGVGAEPVLSLDRRVVEDPQHAAAFAKLKEAATADVAQYDEIESPLLTRFWGRPVKIRAWVILPPTYATHADGNLPDRVLDARIRRRHRRRAGVGPAHLRTHEERARCRP